MKKQIIATTIILLFIGIAVAPSINFTVVKASNENDLIEVTTQACGIKGYGNTTVKLTKQQYQNLEQYLIDFRARLNQTTTRGEAVPLFKEAVVELNKYGLLPKGMSVQKAEKLVIGLYQNTKLIKYLEKLSNKSDKSSLQEGNKFCLIYGEAQGKTYFQGPVGRAISNVLYSLLIISLALEEKTGLFLWLYGLLWYLSAIMGAISLGNLWNLPKICSVIYYGEKQQSPWTVPPNYWPAEGEIWTNGLYGVRNWSGQFYGNLSINRLSILWDTYYPGMNGFTGLRLSSNASDFYFGSALNVNVGPSHP